MIFVETIQTGWINIPSEREQLIGDGEIEREGVKGLQILF